MPETATATDPRLLDLLTDERVVDSIAAALDAERRIHRAYAHAAGDAEGVSRSTFGSLDNDIQRHKNTVVFHARNDREAALRKLTERIERLCEEIARAERDQAQA